MEKIAVLAAGLLLITSIILVSISITPSITGLLTSSPEQTSQNLDSHAWTKAICTKDHFCQDYFIECQDQKPIKLSPITGAGVQFDKNWQDPRQLEQRERLCE